MGTVSAGGSIGPVYVPDAKALQRLEAYPVTIIVDDLIDFGFHPSIIESLRVHQMVVSNAQVRAWLERGIPSRPEGQHGPRGETGPVAEHDDRAPRPHRPHRPHTRRLSGRRVPTV